MKHLQAQLEWIYEAIGGNELDCNDAVLAQINRLDNILHPFISYTPLKEYEEGCGCGKPDSCWECAAIRGGCPEDV